MTRRPRPFNSASAAEICCWTRSSSSGRRREAHVLEELRHGLEQVQQLACALLVLDQGSKHLEGGHQTVSSRRKIAQDHVPGLLAADIAALFAHRLEHVAVADLRPEEANARFAEPALEPEVRHDGRDHRLPTKLAAPLEVERDQRHHLVAVDDPALLVDDDQPVGIAVERKPDVGPPATTVSCSSLGWVEPHSWLMLSPSGARPSGITSAPSSHKASGATW